MPLKSKFVLDSGLIKYILFNKKHKTEISFVTCSKIKVQLISAFNFEK